ncbi:uncharacterized protein LOC122716514 isoform X1 [Apis laboriosa]|uniref:uncharacterized protein LOC122716514 isoform X1 n=1 Tax=Apis laboriosa TaxID=183418 RepID=UPI001CC4B12E|nr:uncharacterized protein LOC122716514 isoform X1 [Apis laboriosa]
MAQLATFVMAVLLTGQVLADIIVQPGYEHSAQQRVATQPPETVRHSVQQDNQQQDRQQEEYVDPGYHLELHPVYGNSYHVPSYAVLPMYPHPGGTMPSMSKAAYKRLLSALGITEVPAIVPPQYYQYLPPAVHSRRKRSNTEKLDSAGQGNKHDENDVAAKPSLNDDAMSVVDLQNQDEKRVKARHSVTLLGLKPSNMRPVHQQYRTYDPQQMAGGQQTLSQANPQETSQQQQAAATPSQTSNPDTENVQRSIFLQDHVSQQPQQFRLEQRKFPELRPLSAGQSSPIVAKSDDHVAARTSLLPKHSGVNNEEIVGTKLGDIYKIKVVQNLHQHGRGRMTENAPKEDVSVNFINPGNNNKGIDKNNLATVQGGAEQPLAVQTGTEQLVQVYQLPDELGTNYVQNPQYIVLPQTYPVNYVGNYVTDNYASTVYPYTPLYSPYKICFESPDNLQPIAYQLV